MEKMLRDIKYTGPQEIKRKPFVNNDLITVNKSPLQAWAFTIKKLGSKDISKIDYVDIIDNIKKYGLIKDIEEEYDSKDKLHVHGIVLLRKGFLRKRICMDGYHVKLDEIYNEEGWRKYINKDKDKFVNDAYAF